MKKLAWMSFVVAALVTVSHLALAVEIDDAPLDTKYFDLQHPRQDDTRSFFLLPSRSDTERNISLQTPVKAQGQRGTCTFFSTVAALESTLIASGDFSTDLDLSEQWLAYLVLHTKTKDGSTSNPNFRTLAKYGMVSESDMPYETLNFLRAPEQELATQRCGMVPETIRKSCLVSHYDPRLLTTPDDWMTSVLNRAQQFRSVHLTAMVDDPEKDYHVRGVSEIKRLLDQGVVLTFGVDFYYGAWNHRKAEELGIGRSLDLWEKGIIGYPAEGSLDREISSKRDSGHSVLIVGYDDDVEVETTVPMVDGTTQTFRYKGVYYIKNSWGTEGFGSKFELNGVPHPGYGMITQQYANEMGGFYRLF